MGALLLLGFAQGVNAGEVVVKEWDFTNNVENGSISSADNGTVVATAGSRRNMTCNLSYTGIATEGLYFWDNWKLYKTYLQNVSGGDRMMVIPDLKKGDVVTFVCADETIVAVGNGELGNYNTDSYTITVSEDGMLPIGVNKQKNIYSIKVTRIIEEGVCEAPQYTISAAGTSRKFTLSCLTPDATIYYSETEKTTEDSGWTEYSSEVTTAAEKIYAYAETSTAKSEVISFETGAGNEIKLNTPAIKVASYANGNYTVNISSVQTDLSIAPSSVSYSYTIDGANETSGSTATVPAGSTLQVWATSEGYANSDNAEWKSAERPTDLIEIWTQDYRNLSQAAGNGAQQIVLGEEPAFSYNDRTFYNIVGYDKEGTINIDVNNNVGLNTATSFFLRCNGNNSGILKNGNSNGTNGYIGINNLVPGQLIIITTNGNPLQAEAGVTLETGMSTSSEFYFTATDTKASIFFPHGTYNYVYTITVKGAESAINLSTDYTYSTFSSTIALDFTENEDVEAYTAKVNGETVELTKVNQVPANTGVIIKNIGEKTSAAVKVIENAAVVENNDLVAVSTAMDAAALVAANAYILVDDNTFKKVAADATGKLAAGKAYLKSAAGARILTIGGSTTGIENVAEKAEKADGAIYNLQGIRVKAPTAPGLYIVNGKVYKF